MEPFVYEALPVRVIFGSGTVAQLAAEADRLGVRRVLVLSTPGRGEGQANEIAAVLGERSAGVHAGAVMHTPVAVTERAGHRQLDRLWSRRGMWDGQGALTAMPK